MSTQQSEPSAVSPVTARKKRPASTVLWAVLAVAVLAIIVYYTRIGAVSDRIRNPEVTGAPRPAEFPLAFPHVLGIMQILLVVSCVVEVTVLVLAWRRYPRHPVLLMAIAVTLLFWLDPFVNWAPYAVYNPQLWHFPEDWPWVSLSPTVEPFIVFFGYITFYLAPYFPAIWILRRIQARRPDDSFVQRHPLISLAGLIFVIGFVYDAAIEIFLTRTGIFIYSQVIPFGSVFAGKPWQFALIWESALITMVMIPAGVLLYRDDTGRTVAEKLAQRARIFVSRPALGTFAVMFVILNIAYVGYGASFTIVKATKAATSVACPWPYPEAKVYDPQGFYEKNGQPGPYYVGLWSGWMSGQPDGRPTVQAPTNAGPCTPGPG